MKKDHTAQMLSLVFFVQAWSAISDSPPSLKYDDSEPSNLVVTVVGYQQVRRHASGIEIPVFSLDDNAGKGDETGILFYILAPTNYAGHFFWVECPRGYGPFEDQRTPSQDLFRKDQLYSFSLANNNIVGMLASQSRLNPDDRLTTWHLGGFPYFWRYQDAFAFGETNKIKLAQCKAALPELKRKLLEEKQRELLTGVKSDERYTLAKAVGDMISEIASCERNVQEAERQIKRLRTVAEDDKNEKGSHK